MALFKICKGAETNLPQTLTNGYCYFCTDTTNFYIDYTDTYGALTRSKISAKYADKLRYTKNGNFVEIEPTDVLTKNNYETAIGVAATDKNGLMSSGDKTKLDGIADGAEVNVQPDWNQNDETAADFVKNRPFYTGDPVETVLVEERTESFVEDSGLYVAEFPSTFEATVGETYKISWDSTVYECTCVDMGDVYVIGNLSIAGAGSDTGEPFLMVVRGGGTIAMETADTSASHTFSISGMTEPVVKIDKKYLPDNLLNITGAAVDQIAKISAVDEGGNPTEWETMDISNFAPAPFKPDGKSYLTFSSSTSFTLKIYNSTKHWDGTIEYFASDKTWTVWDGTTTLSAVSDDGEYVLYLRGSGNTVITGVSTNYRWVLTGTDIKCIGNIENLLGYATVESGAHPTMANHCYRNMFSGCTSLIQAPALPATTLANSCYNGMFDGCTSLIRAPALPATTLASNCYNNMFYGCTSLIQAPALPAITLVNSCYENMFYGCTSLTKAPILPATTLANYCYYYMFYGCTNLTQAPALPATTLKNYCYASMFHACTSLTQAPALPATTLADNCYNRMFYGCTNLTQAPALPATTLADNCYNGMFQFCTSLKLSTTQSDEYTQEYRIPSFGDGVTATNAFLNMFTNTGGTFTGTPEINTTYYLSSDNMIVRETEIATLNGYVRSMIDTVNAAVNNTEMWTFTLSDGTTVTKQVVVK